MNRKVTKIAEKLEFNKILRLKYRFQAAEAIE